MINKKIIGVALIGMIVSSGVITAINAAAAYEGYVFCASGETAYLLDPSGKTVHTWEASASVRGAAYFLTDGSAVFPLKEPDCPVPGGGNLVHGRLQQISWEGEVVWDAVVCDETFTPGYDLHPMPNGNFLVAGSSVNRGLKIAEIKPVGASGKEVVWEFDLPDNLAGNGYINSVCFNPELNYVGIDINRAKKLVVVDYATKEVVYTYAVNSGQATHAAIWVTRYYLGTDIELPDADIAAMRINNFLVVNNTTQVIEVNTVTNTVVKKIPFEFYAHEGSVQRLPNGNTLVNSMDDKATEIDDEGNTVNTITLPGRVNRAYMYGPQYPGIDPNTSSKASIQKAPGVRGFTYNTITGMGKITSANTKGSLLQIHIYSVSGKTVYSASTQGNEALFSTWKLSPGVYYVTFGNTSGTFKACFVKM